MKIIQCYVGNNSMGNPLWIDCKWSSLKEAREEFPEEIYRAVKTESSAPKKTEEFMSTPDSCMMEEN